MQGEGVMCKAKRTATIGKKKKPAVEEEMIFPRRYQEAEHSVYDFLMLFGSYISFKNSFICLRDHAI